MRKVVAIALAGGLVAGLSFAAQAKTFSVPAHEDGPDRPSNAILGSGFPAPEIASGPVRIIAVDPLLAQQESYNLYDEQDHARAEVGANPAMLNALSAAGVPVGDVVDVGTDVNGETTIYIVRG